MLESGSSRRWKEEERRERIIDRTGLSAEITAFWAERLQAGLILNLALLKYCMRVSVVG
jgi:hypothetical protein